jgi:hypothetical protein
LSPTKLTSPALAACRERGVTQILDLLQLATDIQEELLFLPQILRGEEPTQELDLRKIAAVPDWGKQRKLWE